MGGFSDFFIALNAGDINKMTGDISMPNSARQIFAYH